MADIIKFEKAPPDPRKVGFGKRNRECDKYVRMIKLNTVEVPADLLAQATICLAEIQAFDKIGARGMNAAEELLLRIFEQQLSLTEVRRERQHPPRDRGITPPGDGSGE